MADLERVLGGRGGGTWIGPTGSPAPLRPSDVVVMAPYNAQVDELARALQRRGLGDVIVSTVDQVPGPRGRDRPTRSPSTAEDAPRGMDFLYSRNRSASPPARRCAAVAVASPASCALMLHARPAAPGERPVPLGRGGGAGGGWRQLRTPIALPHVICNRGRRYLTVPATAASRLAGPSWLLRQLTKLAQHDVRVDDHRQPFDVRGQGGSPIERPRWMMFEFLSAP
ncbi:MAG: hypothetical protein IPH44_26805 [Myxococcales bacterium]|nr:hypothetical protein [Myxococcales bacterium]